MNDKTHFGFKEVDVSKKAEHVGDVFHSVADEYDLMNDVMSFGLHRLWKKILIELAELNENSVVLDIASGTADIPKLISEEFKSASIHVTDINASMLIRGRERSLNENFFHNCNFALASGEKLPYQDNSFDLIVSGRPSTGFNSFKILSSSSSIIFQTLLKSEETFDSSN